jgi:hypothetical protein
LFYAKNEYSPPHGMIDLAQCTTVKSADLKSKKRHSFEISTPEITFLLYADTEQEKDDWIGRVGKAIVRCSSTYYSQQQQSQQQQRLGGGVMPHGQQQQQYQPGFPGGGSGMNNSNANPYGGQEDDDDDIYYEDPNNPNPYFND